MCYSSILQTLSDTGARPAAARANAALRRLMFDLMDVRTKGVQYSRPSAQQLLQAISTDGFDKGYELGHQASWWSFYMALITNVFPRADEFPEWIAIRTQRVRRGMVCRNAGHQGLKNIKGEVVAACSSGGTPFSTATDAIAAELMVNPVLRDEDSCDAAHLIQQVLTSDVVPEENSTTCPRCEAQHALTARGVIAERIVHVGEVLVCSSVPYVMEVVMPEHAGAPAAPAAPEAREPAKPSKAPKVPEPKLITHANRICWPEVLQIPVQNNVTGADEEATFVLCGLVQHKGADNDLGHFVAYVRKGILNPSWYHVDDYKGTMTNIITEAAPTLQAALDHKRYNYGNKMCGAVYVRQRPLPGTA
jgi:hypothetical protein